MVSLLKSALANTRRASRGPRRTKFRFDLETLESRRLLSAESWPGLLNPQLDAEPNNTLDAAQDIGSVQPHQNAEFIGSLGDGTERNTDVDWLRFSLESAGRVQITSLPNSLDTITPVVLTLYGDQLAEFDPAVPLQHRLLGRSEADPNLSGAQVDVQLSAGTYFVAVSGAGNRYFHPFVDNSGLPALATDYGVRIAFVSGRAPTGNPDQLAPKAETGRLGDDTSKTAKELGDLSMIGRLQVSGVIGDDPFYNVVSHNPFAANPAADVDLYHFSISGNGPFALIAESFAGRIGSPLDPALTLFRADAAGALRIVATNDNTLNDTQSNDGQFPFFTDAALFSALTTGEYFLAVSSSGNDAEAGSGGHFDPQLAHSGINGGSVGQYALDLLVYPDAEAPYVEAEVFNLPEQGDVELLDGQMATLSHAPTHLSLQLSELVNLQQLAFTAFTQVGESTVSSVFIKGADGTRYFPRLESYDTVTGTARFLMLDCVPNGEAELHVSGALGLTDLAGNPVVGNDVSGDFVTHFIVADPSRAEWRLQNASDHDTLDTAQRLGVLFPHELQAGVVLTRDAASNGHRLADTADYFQFELLQTQSYFVTRTNTGSGAAPALKVLDLDGHVVPLLSQPRGQGLLGFLPAGKYVLRVGPWNSANSSNVGYRIEVELGGASENPTPLTSGAAPAVGIRLNSNGSIPISESRAPSIFTGRQPTAEQQLALIPTGLLQGLNAPAIGGQSLTPPGTGRDTALVRLFGFSDRDRLFSLIDSTLPRAADRLRTTQSELTEDELTDILNLDRSIPADADSERSSDSVSPATFLDEDWPIDLPAEGEASTTNDDTGAARPVSQTPLAPSRRDRQPRTESSSSEELPPSALSAPIAWMLANSLANTLRDGARRDLSNRRKGR